MNKIVSALYLFVLFPMSAMATEVVSHRANICNLIENSLEAIERVSLSNVSSVEIDVRVSSDGVVYLYHDNAISYTEVKDLKYSEIVDLAGSVKTPKLRSVFERIQLNEFYILDLKSPWVEQQKALVDVVKESNIPQSKIIIQSHDLQLLQSIKKKLPQSRYFYLSKLRRQFPFFSAPKPERIISEIGDVKIDGVSLKGRRFISKEFVRFLQDSSLDVFIWTINDTDRFEYYRNIGVQGIITDRATDFSKLQHKEFSEEVECSSKEHN